MVDPVLLGNLVDGMILFASICGLHRVAARHACAVLEAARLHMLRVVIARAGASAAFHSDHYPVQVPARRACASRQA